jgi:hypothetical protein
MRNKVPDHRLLEEQLEMEAQMISQELLAQAENELIQHDNDLHRFNLANLYIKSKVSRAHIERGIQYVANILASDKNSELLTSSKKQTSSNHYKRDCMFLMALGFYHLGDYVKSKQWLESLLVFDKENRQAKTMLTLVDEKIHEEGMKGIAIAAGGTIAGISILGAVAGIVAYALLKK